VILWAAALLLVIATLAAWFVAGGARPAARVQLRFAAILFAALPLAAAAAPPAAPAVTLLVLPIGLGIFALAVTAGFSKALAPGLAAILLAALCLGGLAAAITGLAALSLAPSALAIAALIVLFLRQFDAARTASVQGMLAALCFLGAASVFAAEGAGAALLLFAAAGVLGVTLALARSDVAIEERPLADLRGVAAIRGRREA
jgi:hypothetical protein